MVTLCGTGHMVSVAQATGPGGGSPTPVRSGQEALMNVGAVSMISAQVSRGTVVPVPPDP